tara:strand:+ start:240 stop:425 length:186 start_codon:yes stop_codon:yes gene_type:complete
MTVSTGLQAREVSRANRALKGYKVSTVPRGYQEAPDPREILDPRVLPVPIRLLWDPKGLKA